MGKSGKHLTPADLEVWQRVSRTVKAYDPARPLPPVKPAPKNIGTPIALRPRIGSTPPRKTSISEAPPQVVADKRTRRGKISIDRKIDLHDMTQDVAREVLVSALIKASQNNQRCVLVVTGKGGLSYKGVLRRMFPLWLAAPDIRPMIASYAQAHQRHGGAGAWYVFLKRVD